MQEKTQEKTRETQGWLVTLLQSGALSSSERVEAGNILAKIGDPRFRSDAFYLPDEPLLGFVEIPQGSLMMGEGAQRHEVTLPTFYRSVVFPPGSALMVWPI